MSMNLHNAITQMRATAGSYAPDVENEAYRLFAYINGWTFRGKRHPIPKSFVPLDGWMQVAFDHVRYFTRGNRAACLVLQPYDHVSIYDVRRHVESIGNRLFTPPRVSESIYFPGRALFLAMTPRDIHHVNFLPEQIQDSRTEFVKEVKTALARRQRA